MAACGRQPTATSSPTSTPTPTLITISPEEAPGEFLEALPDFETLMEIVTPFEIGTVIWQLVPGSLPQLSKQRSRRPDETPFLCF